MPLTPKGKEIMAAMKSEYGPKKGEQVFYASKNKGTISGVEKHVKGPKWPKMKNTVVDRATCTYPDMFGDLLLGNDTGHNPKRKEGMY